MSNKVKSDRPEVLGWGLFDKFAFPNPVGYGPAPRSEQDVRVDLRRSNDERAELYELVRKIKAENGELKKRNIELETINKSLVIRENQIAVRLRNANIVLEEIQGIVDGKLKRARVDDNQE